MQASFEHVMTRRLVFVSCLLILLSILIYLNGQQALTRQELVIQTHENLNQIEQTFSLLKEAESAQRGYLISDNKSYFDIYSQAVANLQEQLVRLRNAIGSDPTQQKNFQQLEREVNERMELMTESNRLKQTAGMKAVVEKMKRGEGFAIMERIKQTVRMMQDQENQMLAKRSRRLDSSGRTSLMLYGGVIALDCILLVSLFYGNNRLAQRRREVEAQAHFRTMADAAPALLSMTDPEGGMIFFNQSWFKFTGRTLEKEMGRGWLAGVHPDDVAPCEAAFNEGLKNRQTIDVEFRLRRKDGSFAWMLMRAAPRFGPNRTFLGFIGSSINISQRRQIERALAAEKERLAVTLRSIGDAVVTTDDEGRIASLNHAAEQLTGWKEQDAKGRSLDDVFPFDKAASENDAGETASDSDEVKRLILRPANGEERIMAASAAPLENRGGHSAGFVFVFRDITERERLDREMMKATKLESIGLLAGGIAHDFNNILTTVIGNISLAQNAPRLPEDLKRWLDDAEKGALRAKDLTHQLLTFAKGGAPIKKTAFLQDVIRDSTLFALHGSSVAPEFSLAADLWPVEADPAQISQVVENIVLNAAQAMSNGGTVRISASNVENGDAPSGQSTPTRMVSLAIADSGVGISRENLSKIFDPYFTTKDDGSGLGLATCYSIVRRHGGRIEVRSELGIGTTFEIYLPATEMQEIKADPSKNAPRHGHGRILVMDDEELLLSVNETMLEQLGYEVETAHNGQEALRLYAESMKAGRPFNACMLDLTIVGGMNGKDTIRELQKLDPQVRAIVSSGYSNDPIMANFRTHGFSGIICKPYNIDELGRVLQEVLNGGVAA